MGVVESRECRHDDRLATVREAVGRDQRRARERGKKNRTVREGDMKRSIDTQDK